MDIGKLRTDKKLEEEGVWVEWGDAELLIASTNSERYQDALREATMHLRRYSARGGAIPRGRLRQADRILLDLASEHLLRGWKRIQDGGNDLAYSPANARMLLTEVRELREFVEEQAGAVDLFRLHREAIEGN